VLCFSIIISYFYLFFFFFSSRRRHTRFSRDWSSDVCSSDLNRAIRRVALEHGAEWIDLHPAFVAADGSIRDELSNDELHLLGARSEERRVGKECSSRWWPYH